MATLNNTAEGGTDATTVTTGNSGGTSGDAWDAIISGGTSAATFDDTHAFQGLLAYKDVHDGSNTLYRTWTTKLGTVGEAWGRDYLYLTANPAATMGIIRGRNGTTQTFRISITSAGKVVMLNSASSTLATSTASVPLNHWVRIEWHVIALASNGTVEVRLFNSPKSTTPTETLSVATAALTNNMTEIGYGLQNTAGTVWRDGENVNTAGWPGPLRSTPKVELNIDGTWTDVSPYVLYAEGITVTRGRRSESGGMEAQTASLTFKNHDGRFTPRLPTSPYFDKLGRNTEIRIARDNPTGEAWLGVGLGGALPSYAICLDSAGVSITGDTEVQIDVTLDDWGIDQDLCSKYLTAGNQRSWALNIEGGLLQWVWSTDGTTTKNAVATAAIDADPGERVAIKVTHDVNNGASGNDVKFWTADSLSGTWVQLGATVTGSGATSIFDSTANVYVGDLPDSGNEPICGKVHAFKLISGIGGTEKANPDFTAQDSGVDTFTDAAGNAWTFNAHARILQPHRFHGEVSEWPVVSDVTGGFVTVSIEAAGQWRRLSQNEEPLNSAMFRAHTNPALTRIKAYWSLEDLAEATELASNATQVAGFPMRYTGSPELASYDGWTASAAMPTMNGATFTGTVRGYTATGESSVYFFLFVDTAVASETRLFSVRTTGTARNFDVYLTTAGALRVRAQDDDGSAIDDGGGNLDTATTFDLNSRGFVMLGLQLTQDGSDVDWELTMSDFTNTDVMGGLLDVLEATGTITSKTFGIIRSVVVGSSALDEVKISHIAVSDETAAFLTDVDDAIRAYNGEGPVNRLARLGDEEDILYRIVTKAKGGNSASMGDQTIKTFTELLTELENTDLGILHEAREFLGLGYRTRLSLANQEPAVTLSHSSHELGDTLKPVDDDQLTVNEQYVIRDQGIKAYKSKTEGKLSKAKPPQGGVGPYPAEQTVSVTYDQQAIDQAGFRVLLGTQDAARYPQIMVNLHHPSIAGTDLETALLNVDVGDRLVVTDLPDHLPPDDISVLVNGYTERFDQFTHSITFNCVPEAPWRWAVVDDDVKRAAPTAAETVGDMDAGTDTELAVLTTDGPVAINTTDHADDFPFNIRTSGVTLEVTGITSWASDAFGRSATDSWSSPDIGPAYTLVGTAADFDVAAGVGTMTLPTTNAAHLALLAAAHADSDIYVDIATSATATGQSLYGGLVSRCVDNNNFYTARLEFSTSQVIFLNVRKRVAGAETQLASFTVPLTHVAGTFYRVRLQTAGSLVRAKCWLTTGPEPARWQTSAADTDLTAAANLGARSFSNTGNTNVNPVVRYDNLSVVNPQRFTVTQTALNGVTKTIPDGSQVELANPAHVGLV